MTNKPKNPKVARTRNGGTWTESARRTQIVFGAFLRARRLVRRHTLDSLSMETGLAKGLLSRMENAKGNPCLLTLKKLAIALKTKIVVSYG